MLQSVHNLWAELCNLVIRPQRFIYEPNLNLGSSNFPLGSKWYQRVDFDVKSAKTGYTLKCSHFRPLKEDWRTSKIPCVIYCHGNCGSRCDALDAVQLLLPLHISVLAFDFAGSGLSGGEYVSLGYYEQDDLDSVTKYLLSTNEISRIGLWGRSMGGVTSINYSSKNPIISGIVADSPFSSLEQVMIDLVLNNQKWVPKRAIKMGINLMRNSILKRAKFDIKELRPIDRAKSAVAPIILAAAYNDDFVKLSHAEELYKVYNGDKQIIRFEGDHNSARPAFFHESVALFFFHVLIVGSEQEDELYPHAAPYLHGLKTGGPSDFSGIVSNLPHSPIGRDGLIPYSTQDKLKKPEESEDKDLLMALKLSLEEELRECDDDEERAEIERRLEEFQKKLKPQR